MLRIPLRRAAALTAALAAATTLAACTSSGAASRPSRGSTPSGTGAGSLQWHNCSISGVTGTMKCASLQVPLDYARPGDRKITLALSEVPATAPASQQLGDLLVNPGGPGGSGRPWASYIASGLSPSVARRYNIIGFDPRGVGASVPALTCDPGFFAGVQPDYIPANAAAEQTLENRAKAYAAACEQRFGWLLPYMTTRDAARDMDSIRSALGQSRISYFAYSYGTYLGQVYATMFPGRVRHMALDSVVDPQGVWYDDNIEQDYAFQGRMEAFFRWVAQYSDAYHLGTTASQVQEAWYKARNQLQAHPVAAAGGVQIGADKFDDTFLTGGYNDGYWPGLAQALSAYLNQGSDTALISQYEQDGTQNENENEYAVYNAVQCSDVNWPRNWAKWDSDTRRVYATAPFEAWDNTWYNAPCVYWPVRGPAQPMKIGASGLPGILMLQGTLDAATPYAGAQVAHSELPTARMVVVPGGGNHGQSLNSPANTCVNRYLNDYLASGALPTGTGAVDATCPPTAPPTPAG